MMLRIMLRSFIIFIILLTALVKPANAIINIDITRGNIDPLPIALPDLPSQDGRSQELGRNLSQIVANDLETSGLFRAIDQGAFLEQISDKTSTPQFPSWRQINAQALMTGGVSLASATEFSTEFRLWDILAEKQIAGKSYTTNIPNQRRVAHMIADEIYQRITGEKGYFDTRIVYIAESGPDKKKIKRLAIMDFDGENHRYLTDGSNLVLTPRFSPTSQEVIYLEYVNNKPRVYIRNVDSGKAKLVGQFDGMTFAPRFAPDGNSVVMSASLGGNSEIYSYNLSSGSKTRLTNDPAIDTSPSYSPDMKQIVFNSDRGGSQQLYIMNSDGSNVRRISFGSGKYATPVWSPRGDLIAFTKMSGGSFYIGVMRTDGSGERLLTESFLDESPTWSPNGRTIVFSRQTRGVGKSMGNWSIHSVDLTGYNERTLPTPQGASDPAWSPLLF